MGAFRNSFRLVRESFEVLKKDKEMLWFPILSSIVSVAVFLSFFVPLLFLAPPSPSLPTADGMPTGLNPFPEWSLLLLFAFYFLSYFIVIFFNTGLITCAHMRLNGKDPKFSDGFRNAARNIRKIFIWALIAATVGMVLRLLENRLRRIGRLLSGLLGMAWTLLTFFVIPVMIFENLPAFASIKKSGELFKKTWGENVIGQFSMGLFFTLLFAAGFLAIFFSFFSASGAVVGITFAAVLLFWVLLGIISATLNGIFVAALYHYANTGKVPQGYSTELVTGAFRQNMKSGII